ncbi:aldo/keto reductase [Salinispora arenicola]|uniref:aldo/keto reductase n=1 Tax=Salinispora arenicola TaxID=168697 RepID=UPI0004888FCF|nr:aldo/keto reductase [Salinispora arenicola]
MRHVTAAELPPRQLARLGRTSPALAAGCWPLAGPCVNDGADVGWAPTHDIVALDALRAAWEKGLRLFDTADVYGHGRGEERLGYLLAEVPRDQVIVSTKTGYDRRSGHPYQALQIKRHLRRSLTRLGTDYVDIYAYHSTDFGSNDQYLAEAIAQMHEFKREGLIRAIAIRAPHEFATQWADESSPRGQQARRFLHLLHRCQPDLIAARHNLLSAAYQTDETTVIDLARQRGIDLLIKQVLGQGLFIRHPGLPATASLFGAGDHRRQHNWFSPLGRRLIWDGLQPIRNRYGHTPAALANVAIRFALTTAPTAVAMLGFRTASQITTITTPGPALTRPEVADLAATGARIRTNLDQVFPNNRTQP